jgi:hypothetical protein
MDFWTQNMKTRLYGVWYAFDIDLFYFGIENKQTRNAGILSRAGNTANHIQC